MTSSGNDQQLPPDDQKPFETVSKATNPAADTPDESPTPHTLEDRLSPDSLWSPTVLQAAIQYAKAGFRIVPIRAGSKRPAILNWPERASSEPSVIEQWSAENILAACGVMTGEASGLIIVDVDPRNGGDEHIERILASLPVKAAAVTITGGGGKHYWFGHPGGWVASRTGKNGLAPGIELKADGGQMVLVSPSPHPSGTNYRFDPGSPQSASELRMALSTGIYPKPKDVKAEKAEKGTGKKKKELPPADLTAIMNGCAWMRGCRDNVATLPEPEWYAMLSIVGRCEDPIGNALKLSEGHPGYDPEITKQKLDQSIRASGPRTCEGVRSSFGSPSCKDCPFGRRTKFESSPITLGTDRKHSGGFPLTDVGNAERFASAITGRFCYVPERGKWSEYVGHHWATDHSGAAIQSEFVRVIRAIRAEGTAGAEHAFKSEEAGRISAGLRLAAPLCSRSSEQFDGHPFLMASPSGVVDLTTGEIRDGAPDEFISRCATVPYIRGARHPEWESFLSQLTGGDTALLHYVQRCAGYSITGSMKVEAFFVLQGPGGSGKSTFINAIRSCLGDYASNTPAETFIKKDKSGGIPNDLAMLVGRRLVTTTEIEEGKHLAESLVKQVTGGDPLVARFLNKEFFEFQPQFKVWFICNKFPKVKASDTGIWRRVVVLPFRTLPSVVDEELKTRFQLPEVKQAILAWLVEGTRMWLEEGLRPPKTVQDAVTDYRREMDPLGGWVEDCVAFDGYRTATKNSEPIAHVRRSYEQWCSENEEEPLHLRFFNTLLESRGCERRGERKENQPYRKVWAGLRLKINPSTTSNPP